jgi:hypothetical protein
MPFEVRFLKKPFKDFKEEKIDVYREMVSKGIKFYGKMVQMANHYLTIFKNSELLGMSDEDIVLTWIKIREKRHSDLYKLKPVKEGRDNKGVYVGSGGSNRNKVRYPSKKRSKRVWRTFYKMFPRLAEQDGWDGEKSNKM